MHVLRLAFVFLLIGAAPPEVPVGTFQTWLSFKKVPLDFTSDGVTVHVEALPCPAQPIGDASCRWEGYNDQAAVTMRAPGVAPVTVMTDSQSTYARIAVVRFDADDPRPGLIVESQSGGSGGDLTVQLIVPGDNSYLSLALGGRDGPHLQGQIGDSPRDLNGDGHIDLKLEDGAFDSAFGCNACTPRPPRLFAVKAGRIVDESSDPALRSVFAADMARLAPRCLTTTRYRNGACAAYVADAARAGNFRAAWAAMLKHYEPGVDVWQPCGLGDSEQRTDGPAKPVICFRDFPESLRAFLTRAGYLPG